MSDSWKLALNGHIHQILQKVETKVTYVEGNQSLAIIDDTLG